MYSLRSLTIAAIPAAAIPLSTTTTIPTAAPFCTLCWGWHGGRVLCDVLALQHGGGVLHAVLALWEVGGGGALHSVLGWHHSGACAQWVGSVGVLCSMMRWHHGRACVWWVGVRLGLVCRVGMASQWGLHVASQHCGWILHIVMGWWWWQTCMWRRWRWPGLHVVRQRQWQELLRLEGHGMGVGIMWWRGRGLRTQHMG